MPRLLAAEYVYSGALNDSYNDFVTTTTPPPPTVAHAAQQHIETVPQTLQHQIPTIAMPSNTITARSLSPVAEGNTNTPPQPSVVKLPEQIHTISSSDEEEFVVEQNTIEEEITNISSDESGDFEGFDDYTTPNSSGLINDASQEDLNISSNYLKRHSQIDFNEYREDSEGVVEAIEVDDEDEEIVIGDDGQIIYKSREEITPTKTQTYRYEPHTPNKRQKQETERHYNAISPTQLKTPPDQIVEVNSDSTTNSLKQKRQQINTKFQLNLSQQQNHKVNNNPNKCSTESTSEFPVSSPSNPQQPRGGKYPPRPPLLKNTLPADSFERQLAMITACNPQMTLAEKIQTWDCDEELSDVEDVNMFDEEFKRVEKQKKLDIKQREKSGRIKNTEMKIYDFLAFRQMLLRNMKEQKNQKYNVSGQGGSGFGVSGGKFIESSGSESSKSVIHVDDRPTTSAVAQQQLQQRRSKPQINLETGEPKKRLVKEAPKRNQNSTTPPQTSSSDNDRDCFQNSKNQAAHNKLNSRQIHLHGKLCPSSSEEAVSQDVPAHLLLKTNNKCASTTVKNVRKKSPTQPQPPAHQAKSSESTTTLTKNPRIATEEEIDSVFRLHRLNRERDKYNSSLLHEVEEQPSSIIQMRLDFANDTNKTNSLMEKKQELFKTPIIPQKYLANSTLTAENQRQTSLSPTKNVVTANEEISRESPQLLNSSIKSTEEFKNDSSREKLEKQTDNDDLDGVYHQQHEFCNYLGLTGMSTATAMANAVAELAQCNLARRSMRVLRQQQQERRDKSAKEEKQLEALKLKQLKELRKRERGGSDIIPVMETEPTANKSDEGSHSQTSEPTTSAQEPKQKASNNSTTKSSTISQNSFTIIKNEPEIKILCHIAAKNKEEAAKLSQECVKEITQPIRETLMRQAKLRKSITKPLEKSEEDEHDEEKNNGNSNAIDNKILQIIKEQKTDCVEEIAMRDKETPKRTLRSPRLSIGKATLKTTKSRSQILNESKEIVQNHETSAFVCKLECMGDTMSDIKSVATKYATSCLNVEDEMLEQNSNCDDKSLVKPGKHLITSTPSIIQQKLQMALEESRKSKPSIFIVQSLECKKDQAKSLENLHSLNTPLTEVQGHQVIKNVLKKSLKVETKFNKNNIKKVLKTHKGKKYPTSKRQLRKRKIIVIKTIKPKQKSYASLNEIKRELRSSPRINEIQRLDSRVHNNVNNKQKYMPNKTPVSNETKSYRTVHTETKDLEIYLDKHNSQTKTRLMAKASALLERSRMTLRGSCKAAINKSKLTSQIQRSKLNLHGSRTHILRPRIDDTTSEKRKFKSISTSAKLLQMPTLQEIVTANKTPQLANNPSINLLENENVVVSSTTNTYDERPSHEPLPTQSPITLRSLHNAAAFVIASSPMETKDQFTQCCNNSRVQYLNTAPLPVQTMRNPLKSDHGVVLYMYHELDILIVIQERLVSFWKCSKLINILAMLPTSKPACTHNSVLQSETITMQKQNNVEHCCNNQLRQPASSSTLMEPNTGGEWIQLGELRRLNCDFEISVPYANRICLHNSTPIYLEMRARQLPKNQRDCNLLSMYINIYYYHDEDMIAKCNSIPLDTIQSDIHSVNYTTLIDSRYFIMTWPQENLLGKTRSGLCKYSLTPQLDTLASIREFKSMRHTVRYLECMSDDKLIGFGETQVTIWDHRSGDVLMNFDLEIPMGKNLGSIYFSSQDIEQNNMLILHQYRDFQNDTPPELMTLACTITHAQPSYRVLQEIRLPMPAFKTIKSSINSGDHLVVTGQNDDELWICATNPRLITIINTIENSKRFYNRERSQLIELTEKTLNINTLANHILELAAGKYEA